MARLIHCAECGRNKRHKAKGLCARCYGYEYRRQYQRPIVMCAGCHEVRPHHGLGLCATCYSRQYQSPVVTCRECGEERPHYAYGLCKACYDRPYRQATADRRQQYNRQWCLEHPERAKVHRREAERRRRARKARATTGPIDEAAIYARDGHRCIYCGAAEGLELDHIVPLAGGGPHCQDNLAVACRRCNASKGARPLEEWLQTQPYSVAWVM